MAARVVFIKWLVTFFLEKKYLTAVQNSKNGGEMLPKIIQVGFKVCLPSCIPAVPLTGSQRDAAPQGINDVAAPGFGNSLEVFFPPHNFCTTSFSSIIFGLWEFTL